jgi:UDP-glucose 4-epimerase
MRILVTGGAGYIGSHTCVELLTADHDVVVVDNLINSQIESIKRVEEITEKKVTFYQADVRDARALNKIFKQEKIDAVMHFSGSKAVGESTQIPLSYYDNNVHATRVLLDVMLKHHINVFVFSSSATVYGDPDVVPITENSSLEPTNPYGRTKLIVEQMLDDLVASVPYFSSIVLRYFNPVGAHQSGLIGEDPTGIPNNLMPFIAQVAVGKIDKLSVFGDDYPTVDGTGVRDYIHVCDLALGHVKALEILHEKNGCHILNLGTGHGVSVLEMVRAFEKASGVQIPFEVSSRRSGDIATCFADPSYANHILQWQAQRTLTQMVTDSWRWQNSNPQGYSVN